MLPGLSLWGVAGLLSVAMAVFYHSSSHQVVVLLLLEGPKHLLACYPLDHFS